ncbi:DUF4267 domain-containing protein [Nocardia cyriacigeorgica]|uniref:DUF4267 domain-containing protein n=1 Tax=Nocardia cyriacigeorgica TaxID=135487 RepID=A0A6P1DB75_9NOCA|nr:DUF4267 domain-containing protein [Nocardia cyriacigeorgica]NEW40383.1 DUF4267 domain-containing protein [Nocardia cyriacigeorgica]NEW45562.1 DUF4267 domain-containing protein [Nocardia cyriacigeorgica]NEW50669.1 DUF4267 domain-containing protein [Nocardia cyriacigeorgica]NEW54843.1 DUF4267 domain-containing protein [Nocardia cyriacigeorgica]
MPLSRINTGLSLLGAAFILYIGISYLITPETIATGFGLPAWPEGEASAFMNLKGVRDTASGVLILALLATGHRHALGIALLAMSLVPIGDMLTVLSWDGSTAIALGVHGLTAAWVAVTGGLLLREPRVQRTDSISHRPATVPA